MGKIFSTVAYYCPERVAATIDGMYNRRMVKRKREAEENEEAELKESLHVSKRMKLTCTAQYIYQALFVEGKDSDITVNILKKDWKLHKIYLGQSQYFGSMFSGSWNETNKSYISIEVGDPNITEEALKTVFGSFYLDEVKLEPSSVVGVLAAATMFQMDGLIEQCKDIMIDSICPLTAVDYYNASQRYGLKAVYSTALNWFVVNFTSYYSKHAGRLKEIETDLMLSIVTHRDLVVIQTEMALYCVLRKWLYIQVHLAEEETINDDLNVKDIEEYFRINKGQQPFLLSDVGLPFMNIFKHLKIHNLILSLYDIPAIITDGIIPEGWLLDAYKKQWLTLLEIYNGHKGNITCDEKHFYKYCFRCGRVIRAEDSLSWRWSGFFFGLDLIWSLTDNSITLKRQRTQFDSNANSPHNILLKVDIFSVNEKRQVKNHTGTAIQSIPLMRHQEVKVLSFDKALEYPIYFVVKILFTERELKQDKANLHSNSPLPLISPQ